MPTREEIIRYQEQRKEEELSAKRASLPEKRNPITGALERQPVLEAQADPSAFKQPLITPEERVYARYKESERGDGPPLTDEEMLEMGLGNNQLIKDIAVHMGGWTAVYATLNKVGKVMDMADLASIAVGTPPGKGKALRKGMKKLARPALEKVVQNRMKRMAMDKDTMSLMLGKAAKFGSKDTFKKRFASEIATVIASDLIFEGARGVVTGGRTFEEYYSDFTLGMGALYLGGAGLASGPLKAFKGAKKVALAKESGVLYSGLAGSKQMWEMMWRPAEWAFQKTMNIPIIPKPLRGPLGSPEGKLKSVFFTAEERLHKKGGKYRQASEAMRKKERYSSLARQATNKMADEIDLLSAPGKRVLLENFKRGNYSVSSLLDFDDYLKLPLKERQAIHKATAAVEEWKLLGVEDSSQLNKLRHSKIVDNLQMRFEEELASKGAILSTKHFKSVMDELKVLGKEDASGASLNKGLKKIYNNPTYSDEIRDMARDLYSVSGYTMEAIPRMAAAVEEMVLFEKLKSIPGLASERPLPGYVRRYKGEFKDLYVPEDLNDGLVALEHVTGDTMKMYNRFFLSPWKLGKVVLRVPSQIRNAMANIGTNDWGGLPFYKAFDPRLAHNPYRESWQILAREMKGKGSSGILKEFRQHTGVATTFTDVETHYLPQALKWDSSIWDYMEYAFTHKVPPMRFMIKNYQMVETWAKLAKYIDNKRLGMDASEAALDAVKWTFNYGEVTPALKLARSTISPFATWTFKIMPLFFETMKNHPWRLSKWAAIPTAMSAIAADKMGITDGEWEGIKEVMPEWQKNGWHMMMPTRDSKDRLQMMNLTWMVPGFGDLSDIDSEGVFGLRSIIGNPMITVSGELMNNKTFSGAPIYNDWDSGGMKFAKGTGHVWKQMMPAFMGETWSRLYKTAADKPGAQTWGQHAAGLGGFKVVPIDEDLNEVRFWRGKKRQAKDIKAAFRSAGRLDIPPFITDQLYNYYEKRLEALYEEESQVERTLRSPLSPVPGMVVDAAKLLEP